MASEVSKYKGDRLEVLTQYMSDLGAPRAANAIITISPSILLVSQLIIAANPDRKGLIIYNNSANSVYLAYGSPASSSTNMTRILPTFTQFIMEVPIYTGPIYGIRNAGSGTCLVTQLT